MKFVEKQLKRLHTAVELSSKKLKVHRDNNKKMIQQYVGYHYSQTGTSKRTPVNMMELAINIYKTHLVSSCPKAMVTTDYMQLNSIAYKLQLALNHLFKEIEFESTLEKGILNALFSVGIFKTGLTTRADKRGYEVDGYLHDYGQPFCDVIEIDDWVMDMSAKTFDQQQFMGNRFRVDYKWAMESGFFSPKVKDSIEKLDRSFDDSSANLSGSDNAGQDFHEKAEFWDIWLPQENVIVTVQQDGHSETFGKPLAVTDWNGAETGPYDLLSYNPVPGGNLMPLAPASLWIDFNELGNNLFRKLESQARRQKTLLGVRGDSKEDGRRVTAGNDGETVTMDDPSGAREYKFGGIDQSTLAFFIQTKDLFSYFAGNIDALGGLSPQADTLGQDQMLTANASRRLVGMQKTTYKFVKKLVQKLGYYLWTDPLTEIPMVKRVPGVDIGLPTKFTPEEREGDFLQYNIKIEPHSMQEKSPEERLQTIFNVLERIQPYMPAMQAQGISLDVEELVTLIARYSDMPEFKSLLYSESRQLEQPVMAGGGKGEMPAKPATTKRVYERINRPGATRAGKDATLTQNLLGNKMQPAEQAQLFRGVG